MPRNTKKLEMFRRKQEEIDDLLREAGMYEEGLSQTVKDQLVQFLEESRESARLEQEERLSQQWQEERILTETLSRSSSHQRVPGSSSSSSSSKSSTVNTQIQNKSEDLVLLTLEQPDELECQVIKGGTGHALGTSVKSHHSGRPWQEGRVEVGATASPCLAPLASVSSTLGRGRMAAATSTGTATTTTTTTMANDSTHKALTSATNTGSMQNNSDDDDDDIDIVPPTPDSPTKPPKRPLSPCVVLVPLPFDLPSPRKKARSFGEVVGPSPRMTRKKATANSSTGNTTGPPHSPFLIEEVSSAPNSPTEELAATPTPPEASHSLAMLVSPVVSRGRLPTTTTAASSANTTKHNNNSITTTKTTTTKYNKSKIVTTTTRVTQLNDDDDIDLVPSTPDSSGTLSTRAPTPCVISAPHCHASPRHNSSPVSGRVTTSSSRKVEKGATPATQSSDLYHNEKSFMKTASISAQAMSPEPKVEANSPQPAFSHSDREEKPILGRQYCPINVFFRRAGYSDAPLSRQRPLRSQAPDTALHPLPNETLEQARARIMALLDSTSQLLLQHKARQLPCAGRLPLTVNSQLRDSLDRPQSPPPRVVARRRPLRERRREERRSQEVQGSSETPEAPEELEALETKEALVGSKRREVGSRLASVLHRPGLQGGSSSSSSSSRKKLAIIPLPKVSSDSDTDVETGSIQPVLASPPVPSPPRAVGGTVPGCQPQTSSGRRTFKLLDSDSEGEECYSRSSVAATTSRVGSGPLLEKGMPSPQPGSSDLCLKEQQQQQRQPSDLDVVAHTGAKQAAAQRGRRRPAAPDLTGPAPGNSDQQTSQSLLDTESSEASKLVHECNAEQGQSQEEEEEKISCPICQKFFPLHHIEVHASDCMGMEEDSQQEQQQQQHQQQQLQQQENHEHHQQQQKQQQEQQQQQDGLSTHGPQTRRRKRDEAQKPIENGPTSHLQEDSPVKDSKEVDSHHSPASSWPDTEEKIINVFVRGDGHSDAPLSRQRPLRSQAPDTALHPLPNETLEQARARIMALLDSTSQLLLQHKASQLPHAWSLPLTVNSQLRDSLDHPRPPVPHVVARRQALRERRREKRQSQEAQGSSEAPAAPETEETEETFIGSKRRGVGSRLLKSVLHRPGQARIPGLQGGSSSSSSSGRKKLAIIPLPKVSSDSDTDVETGSIQPVLASPPVPSPPRAVGGTVPGCQPQTSSGRRTFKLLDSDSEGEECYSRSSVAATTSKVGSGPLLEKGMSSSQPGSSDLCLKEQQQQQQQPSDLNVVPHAGAKQAAAQRGRRRPAAPDLTELMPGKHRKMHILHTVSSDQEEPTVSSDQEEPTVSSDHEESETLLQAAGVRLANKWSDDQRQSLEEEEPEGQNFPCPMCQKFFPLQHIEVHASDCMGVEEDVQQQQHDIHMHVSKTRRRLRFKPPEDGSKMKRGQGRPLSQEVPQMKKEFSEPDSHFGIEDSRPSSPEY